MNSAVLNILLYIIRNEKLINNKCVIDDNFIISHVVEDRYCVKYRNRIILAIWISDSVVLKRNDGADDEVILKFKESVYNKYILSNYF